MDLQELKDGLLNWLEEVEDSRILQQIQAIKDGDDWWNRVSLKEKESINTGLQHLDNGETHSHQEVMAKIKAKFNN